jgi:hypothetical protein
MHRFIHSALPPDMQRVLHAEPCKRGKFRVIAGDSGAGGVRRRLARTLPHTTAMRAAAVRMNPLVIATLIAWAAIIFQVAAGGESPSAMATESPSAASGRSPMNGQHDAQRNGQRPHSTNNAQRHHYVMNARVRLLLFWVGRDDVGDAVVAKRQNGEAVGYSLLIGSDPDRAPRRINRWGYIDEEIRGDTAKLVGLMTESDEESVSEAEANLRKGAGQHTFNVIRASIADGESRSVVTSIATPQEYTLHQVDAVLNLALDQASRPPNTSRAPDTGKARVIQYPAGTRPGFLAAVADAMHQQVSHWQTLQHVAQHAPQRLSLGQSSGLSLGEPITYVYHGKLYQLRMTRTQALSDVRIGDTTYEHVIASELQIKNMRSGELTDFSMTFAADGPLAETPLAVTYRPRWWLEVQLKLDDKTAGPALARGPESSGF